jgi:hypothetical protein
MFMLIHENQTDIDKDKKIQELEKENDTLKKVIEGYRKSLTHAYDLLDEKGILPVGLNPNEKK